MEEIKTISRTVKRKFRIVDSGAKYVKKAGPKIGVGLIATTMLLSKKGQEDEEDNSSSDN